MMGVMETVEGRIEGVDRMVAGGRGVQRGHEVAAARRGTWRGARRLAAALVVTIALATPRVAAAAEPPQYANDFGIGIGAVLIDLVYMPVKVVYATLGGITGGFAFVLTGGRSDIATSIWRPSLGGTYVITPTMLRGDEPINFSGGGDDNGSREESRPAPREEPLRERDHSGRGESY
jgi:hypothetical protein